MASYLTIESDKQPLLCTHVDCEIRSDDASVILYRARNNLGGSIVSYWRGPLGANSMAEIQSSLTY